jgi:8-oxo-dGTP pyrophosphatase MutT (NUDIX family)
MRFLERIGIVGFYLAWPAFFVYLSRSERTRVIIVCQGKVLVVRNWLSDGRWSLPGGGLHKGEDPRLGAIRELFEETGIRIESDHLIELGTGRWQLHGLGYTFRSYVVCLDTEPQLHRQHIEISRLVWKQANELTPRQTSPDVLMSLAMLKTQHPDFLIQ